MIKRVALCTGVSVARNSPLKSMFLMLHLRCCRVLILCCFDLVLFLFPSPAPTVILPTATVPSVHFDTSSTLFLLPCFILIVRPRINLYIKCSFIFFSPPKLLRTPLPHLPLYIKCTFIFISPPKRSPLPHLPPVPLPVRSLTVRRTVPLPAGPSTSATPPSSGKLKSRSRSKSPFRSFRWRTAKKLLAGTHHSDDEGTITDRDT